MDRTDHLRVFIRIAACGSFSLAADQLGLSRAAVSIAMQQLEARLGTRLLHRTTRRVGLTRDGESLLARASALVADMDELEQQFRPARSVVAGRLRVDLPSRIARRLVAPALPALLTRHPELYVELGSTDRQIDLVQEGVDGALRVGTLAPSSLVARPLGEIELINCASPQYLSRYGTPRSVADLDRHLAIDYVSPGSGRAAAWEWVADGRMQATTLRSRVGANNAETYIACALAGAGLIQIPEFDVREHLAAGELVRVLPDANPPPMPVHFVYPHRRHLSRRLQVFIAWLQELMAAYVARR